MWLGEFMSFLRPKYKYLWSYLDISNVPHLDQRGTHPLCFRIGDGKDNFIFYIGYCFFFVPVMIFR